jgi:hypothetical protein
LLIHGYKVIIEEFMVNCSARYKIQAPAKSFGSREFLQILPGHGAGEIARSFSGYPDEID